MTGIDTVLDLVDGQWPYNADAVEVAVVDGLVQKCLGKCMNHEGVVRGYENITAPRMARPFVDEATSFEEWLFLTDPEVMTIFGDEKDSCDVCREQGRSASIGDRVHALCVPAGGTVAVLHFCDTCRHVMDAQVADLRWVRTDAM